MTGTSSPSTTQPVTQTVPVAAALLSTPPLNGSVSDTYLPEEDYTIKCVCSFDDDDGNTVLCEKCDTWQHIECYYHGKKVPDVHNCIDCEPRFIDTRRATERQRKLRDVSQSNNADSGDRKPKRPATKSHKKKVRDSVSLSDQINGWSHGRQDSDSVPRDQGPPMKRPKTSHRNAGSVSSQTSTPILSHESHKRAPSTNQTYPSPTKSSSSNGPQMPMYSTEFLHLYDNDAGPTDIKVNAYHTIMAANKLSSWLQDPQALRQATGRSAVEIFNFADEPFDSLKWPQVSKQTKTESSVEFESRHPTWKYLRLETPVHKDDPVGEVKGHIGLLEDYCLDPANRYQELRHPEPFVFFHPYLPIYIDARKEGTQFKYVRRSCRPNLSLKTYITKEHEYRFCFVANQEITAGTELTAAWYLDTQVFNRVKDEATNEEPDQRPLWVSQVLANFGDCACQPPPVCSFAALDLRRLPNSSSKSSSGKRKRAKPKQGISPMSTGHATNSRAGSETIRMQDDDDQADSRSTSGSARSKPQSRDLTPTSGLAIDIQNLNGLELSEREKRKIAATERKFELLEQSQQGHRKKKRVSGGHTQNNSSISSVFSNPNTLSLSSLTDCPLKKHPLQTAASAPTASGLSAHSGYIDASTSRGVTGSPPVNFLQNSGRSRRGSNSSPKRCSAPNTPHVPSPLSKPEYVDVSIQCDRDAFDPECDKPKVIKIPIDLFPTNISEAMPPPSFVPYAKRLAMQALGARQELEVKSLSNSPPISKNNATGGVMASNAGPTVQSDAQATAPPTKQDSDVEMKDVTTSATDSASDAPARDTVGSASNPGPGVVNPELTTKPPPPPWPTNASHISPLRNALNGFRAPGLRVQLPPTPQLSNPSPNATNASPTPTTVSASIGQSPCSMPSASSQPGLQNAGTSVSTPSPVKKKLSLGDYMTRKSNMAAGNEKSGLSTVQATPSCAESSVASSVTPLKPSESLITDAKARPSEGSAIVDTPMKDADNPMSNVTPTNAAPNMESSV